MLLGIGRGGGATYSTFLFKCDWGGQGEMKEKIILKSINILVHFLKSVSSLIL